MGFGGLNENKGVSYHEANPLPLQRKENKGKLKMKLLVQQQQGEGTVSSTLCLSSATSSSPGLSGEAQTYQSS